MKISKRIGSLLVSSVALGGPAQSREHCGAAMKNGIDPNYRRGTSLLAMAMLGSLVFAAEPAMAQKSPTSSSS